MLEYNVLVDPDKLDEKTKGGLYMPEETKDRKQAQQIKGTLVLVSPMAFAFEDWPKDWAKPQPGDRVMFAKHAGMFYTHDDGHE